MSEGFTQSASVSHQLLSGVLLAEGNKMFSFGRFYNKDSEMYFNMYDSLTSLCLFHSFFFVSPECLVE